MTRRLFDGLLIAMVLLAFGAVLSKVIADEIISGDPSKVVVKSTPENGDPSPRRTATGTPRLGDAGPNETATPATTPTSTAEPTGLPVVQNPRQSADSFHAGAAVLLYQPYDGWEQDIIRWYSYLAERGVNAVSLSMPIFTDNITSNVVFTNSQTPSDEKLRFAIRQAHQMGFSVFLRPLLDEADLKEANPLDWRGKLRPASVAAWFESYGALVLHYAKLAEEERVEMFSVGTELVSLADKTDRWKDLIANVREIYSGQLTYDAHPTEMEKVKFWGELDFIGIDAYFGLNVSDTPSLDELIVAWNRKTYSGVPLQQMRNVHDTWGKPIILTEFGMIPRAGSEKQPWEWAGSSPPTEEDLIAQANYYRAGFMATAKPFINGYYIWVISPNQDPTQGKSDPGFSPWGKPAEDVIAEFYQQRGR